MAGELSLKWNPKNLEIKTRSVEKTLEPLVIQVTTLVSSKSLKKRKGKSKRAHVLVAAVERATQNFVEKGELIANENPQIKNEMLAAVEDVKTAGSSMSESAREFANDPFSSAKRGTMIRASRSLLSAVTRLLIIADMIDVHLLLNKVRTVEDDLEYLKNVSTQADLLESMKRFGASAADVLEQSGKRQQELMDSMMRDELAAARAVLKKHSMMLLTASKVYVRHPELGAAKENRDYVLRQVCEAVNTISDVAQGKRGPSANNLEGQGGELAAALDDFDDRVIMNSLTYDDSKMRPALEESLESIISGSALIADSSCTRDERREKIVMECNAVRQALQELLNEYMNNSGNPPTERLNVAIETMGLKTNDLRRQLRKAVVDHVADSFLDSGVPINLLVSAALAGDEQQVSEYSKLFNEHAAKLVEVANLACSMSTNEDGVKMVRHAAQQIANLCPQVINAAHVLASRSKSKPAQENMDIFKNAWEQQVRLLTDAVDDIVTVDDFLSVSENHILEDVNRCCLALQEKDAETLDRIAGAIQGRTNRIGDVVATEMDNYEPGVYTERVLSAVRMLRGQILPSFSTKVNEAINSIDPAGGAIGANVDENEFIDASRMVYDGVRDVRRAVLLNRGEGDYESDTDIEAASEVGSSIPESHKHDTTNIDEYPEITGITNAREAMKILPEEDKIKIAEQVAEFKTERQKFDREVSKWDDNGNDVIVLAKHMCLIMMEMTDFTRGKGPLKTTMDVIEAAQKISEAGTKLDKLARLIADECPESSTKKDLIAYLQRIALYCHQLNITSKVKADVQNVSGELIVSGLDSATSLIQAAKNLMNAVVLTVKASYVASTKYKKKQVDKEAAPLVVWKMKAPEKKPLVRPEAPEESRLKVRRGSTKKKQNPMEILSDFDQI